jgi:monofunctional biosynthetic peptidoglycan transglycosylase
MSYPLPRVWRWFCILLLLILIIPFPIVLALRVCEPPTTMVMLLHTVQRWLDGERPLYPRRRPVPMTHISPYLRRAVLAAEDARFYGHFGFDFHEIAHALDDYEQGKGLRGASTITQQTAKNLFLWDGRSWLRKAFEAYLAVMLETLLPKDRILEIYLNLAEWGDAVFGAEMAAEVHYGKAAVALSRQEAARLAAILPNPRGWKVNDPATRRRARIILERMSTQGAR